MVYLPFARREASASHQAVTTETVQALDTSAAAHVGKPEKLSLWERLTTVKVNPVTNKCTTLPVFRLDNPYSINFHLYVYLS